MKNEITPKFTKNLSNIVDKISNGKYNKIKFVDGEGLIVELENGEYVNANKLSIGTIDELYLSLRLSAIEEITREKMPIILDEAFAYFDNQRLENILEFINNNLTENQVIIFTCSNREKDILNKKNILYYKSKDVSLPNITFLNTMLFDNENDNSIVTLINESGLRFLLMGDAGKDAENAIMNKYILKDITILKVGHHGSITSSTKTFINYIKPKFSIISVGKKNRFGHPNKEVLNNLKQSKVYRTDQDGSIMFKIKNDKLKIKTCSS